MDTWGKKCPKGGKIHTGSQFWRYEVHAETASKAETSLQRDLEESLSSWQTGGREKEVSTDEVYPSKTVLNPPLQLGSMSWLPAFGNGAIKL